MNKLITLILTSILILSFNNVFAQFTSTGDGWSFAINDGDFKQLQRQSSGKGVKLVMFSNWLSDRTYLNIDKNAEFLPMKGLQSFSRDNNSELNKKTELNKKAEIRKKSELKGVLKVAVIDSYGSMIAEEDLDIKITSGRHRVSNIIQGSRLQTVLSRILPGEHFYPEKIYRPDREFSSTSKNINYSNLAVQTGGFSVQKAKKNRNTVSIVLLAYIPSDQVIPGDMYTPDDQSIPGDMYTPDDQFLPGDQFDPRPQAIAIVGTINR
ncbi:MAG: hypothetical protein GVY20_09165 [Bacteroidetes bacterium]|jgi:hypothetical protein|nr:hypothetical protein [Bacteroidota bacterium]